MSVEYKVMIDVLHATTEDASLSAIYTECRNALLLSSEEDGPCSELEFEENILLQTPEICAWSLSSEASNPDPLPTNRKKAKPIAYEADFGQVTAIDSSLKDELGSEFEFVNGPSWQSAVDPKTYHYLPHNGRYRATKLAKRIGINNGKSINRKGFGNPRSSRESKALLLELIQKELKSEYDMFLLVEKQRQSLQRENEARLNNNTDTVHTDASCTLAACNASAATNSQVDFKASDAGTSRRPVPPLSMNHLTKEEGVRYLEQVSSRLRELQLSLRESSDADDDNNDDREPSTQLPSQDRQMSTASAPAMATVGKQIDVSGLNRHKKLPAIRTEAKHESSELEVKGDESGKSASAKVGDASAQQRWHGTLLTQDDDTVQSGVHMSRPFFFYPPEAMRLRHVQKPPKAPSATETEPAAGDAKTATGYRLSRATENSANTHDLQTLTLLDDIRASYNQAAVTQDEDDVSCESRPVGGFRVVSPSRGDGRPPLPNITARNPALIFKDWKQRNAKSISGANNNFLRRPRPGLTPPAVLDVLSAVRSRGSSPLNVERRLPATVTAVRGNMMPEVMVKRAGLAVSSKRII